MQQPLRITFKEMEPSDAIEKWVLAEGEGEAGPQASAVELIGEVEP